PGAPDFPRCLGRLAPERTCSRRNAHGIGWRRAPAPPRLLRVLRRAALLRPWAGWAPARPARCRPPALEHAHRTRPGIGHGRALARVQSRLRALLRQYERRDAFGGPLRWRRADRLHRGSRAAGLVLPHWSRPAWSHARGGRAARP